MAGAEGRTGKVSLGLRGSRLSRVILKRKDTMKMGFLWAPPVRPPVKFRNRTRGHFKLTLKKLVWSH